MGLTIYYKGRLRSKEILSELIEELTDIAQIHSWRYHVFETDFKNSKFHSEEFDDEIYGILVSPPESEPVYFTFLSNGVMCSPFALDYYLKTQDKSLMEGLFTKTQYAGPSVHKQVVYLMEYINLKYLEGLEVIDETDFWIHRDEDILNKKFEEMSRILNYVFDKLSNAKLSQGEDLEDFFKALISNFKGRKSDD